MNDYIDGPPCNLVLHESARKNGEKKESEDTLEGFPPELISIADKILSKWSDLEKVRFKSMSGKARDDEFIRLVKLHGMDV